jgi:hypothetical protein
MDMHPPNDMEMDTLRHILLTSDNIWNPSCINDKFLLMISSSTLLTIPGIKTLE